MGSNEGSSSNHVTAVFPTVEALATHLGISRQSAYAALRSGIIPHVRIGKRFILPRAAIDRWLRNAGREGHLTGTNLV